MFNALFIIFSIFSIFTIFSIFYLVYFFNLYNVLFSIFFIFSIYIIMSNMCAYCQREIYSGEGGGCQACRNCGKKWHKNCQSQAARSGQRGGAGNFLPCPSCGSLDQGPCNDLQLQEGGRRKKTQRRRKMNRRKMNRRSKTQRRRRH